MLKCLSKRWGGAIGGEGSWDKGLSVMDGTLAEMGLDTKNMLFRDGSGMSHKNLVTANEVTSLLYKAQSESWYPSIPECTSCCGA